MLLPHGVSAPGQHAAEKQPSPVGASVPYRHTPEAQSQAATTKTVLSSQASKLVLGGPHSPVDQDRGRQMMEQALRLSQQAGKLTEAADLMEEAFNKSPSLRAEKEYLVKLWRRGIVTPARM